MNLAEFAKRRKQLMRMMDPDSIAILPAAPIRVRNRDVEYTYRQDSDFYYVTGYPEPEAVAVLAPGRGHGEYVVFCRERDQKSETWHGRRSGTEGAIENFGADDAFPIGDIDDILPGMLEKCDRVYYTMGTHLDFDQRVIGWVNHIRRVTRSHAPQEFISLEHILHDMRLYKSRAEISAMRKSARVAVRAHEKAMRACEPGMFEYEVEAELLHEFRRAGGGPSYPSIVGGGDNGCVLHYIENDAPLKDGDLLLVDAGCELDYYASDVTRTFPVNGRFSGPQREIYEIVLAAQNAAIKKTVAGNHWNEPHQAALRVITRGLMTLGLIKEKTLPKAIKNEAYLPFFMHRTGHWLGMDVHDVGDYKVDDHWRVLEPGMVLTVEPGIYIAPDNHSVAKKWRGIGVRIEDDVLVTKSKADVLTKDLVKKAEDVENLMAA